MSVFGMCGTRALAAPKISSARAQAAVAARAHGVGVAQGSLQRVVAEAEASALSKRTKGVAEASAQLFLVFTC